MKRKQMKCFKNVKYGHVVVKIPSQGGKKAEMGALTYLQL